MKRYLSGLAALLLATACSIGCGAPVEEKAPDIPALTITAGEMTVPYTRLPSDERDLAARQQEAFSQLDGYGYDIPAVRLGTEIIFHFSGVLPDETSLTGWIASVNGAERYEQFMQTIETPVVEGTVRFVLNEDITALLSVDDTDFREGAVRRAFYFTCRFGESTAEYVFQLDTDALKDRTQSAEDRIEAMLPAMDSVLRVLANSDGGYKPEDNMFFWQVMYLMGVNYGCTDECVTQTQEETIVPAELMKKFAGTVLVDFDGTLPQIPNSLWGVRYDAEDDTYVLDNSDSGDAVTTVTSYLGGDGVLVTVALQTWDGEILHSMECSLVPNAYMAAQGDTTFRYCIADAAFSSAD